MPSELSPSARCTFVGEAVVCQVNHRAAAQLAKFPRAGRMGQVEALCRVFANDQIETRGLERQFMVSSMHPRDSSGGVLPISHLGKRAAFGAWVCDRYLPAHGRKGSNCTADRVPYEKCGSRLLRQQNRPGSAAFFHQHHDQIPLGGGEASQEGLEEFPPAGTRGRLLQMLDQGRAGKRITIHPAGTPLLVVRGGVSAPGSRGAIRAAASPKRAGIISSVLRGGARGIRAVQAIRIAG